ncbi:MAG: hypothetical protein ACQ9MH_08780 [Nitrospinales bacterium]
MFKIIEMDLPEDLPGESQIGASDVARKLWVQLKNVNQIGFAVIYDIEFLSRFSKLKFPKILLPDSFEDIDEPTLEKLTLKESSIFIFCTSTQEELIKFFSENEYIKSNHLSNTFDHTIFKGRENDLLAIVKVSNWKGNVVYFYHDACPAYIFSTCE